MRREDIRYRSACSQADIEAVLWLPKQEPKGVVQIVHGMQEHIGRYEPFAKVLCEEGFAVCGENHLGHGGSLVDGIQGHFGDDDQLSALLSDIDALRMRMTRRFEGLPYLMFGHSMGSFLTRLYLCKDAEGLTGVVLSGTAGPNPLARWIMAPAARLVWLVRGPRYRSRQLARLMGETFNRRFKTTGGSQNNWISSVPEEVSCYDADPQTRFILTVSAHDTLFRMLTEVSSKRWAGHVPVGLPLLLIAGCDDPVGDFGRGPRRVVNRLKAAGVRDVSLKLYPGARHELLREHCRDEVIGDVLHWIEEHI